MQKKLVCDFVIIYYWTMYITDNHSWILLEKKNTAQTTKMFHKNTSMETFHSTKCSLLWKRFL